MQPTAISLRCFKFAVQISSARDTLKPGGAGAEGPTGTMPGAVQEAAAGGAGHCSAVEAAAHGPTEGRLPHSSRQVHFPPLRNPYMKVLYPIDIKLQQHSTFQIRIFRRTTVYLDLACLGGFCLHCCKVLAIMQCWLMTGSGQLHMLNGLAARVPL